jgi:hypothetical protein
MRMVVALIFKRIETLVLNFPSASTCLSHGNDIRYIHFYVSYPAMCLSDFSSAIFKLILRPIHHYRLFISIERHIIFPTYKYVDCFYHQSIQWWAARKLATKRLEALSSQSCFFVPSLFLIASGITGIRVHDGTF